MKYRDEQTNQPTLIVLLPKKINQRTISLGIFSPPKNQNSFWHHRKVSTISNLSPSENSVEVQKQIAHSPHHFIYIVCTLLQQTQYNTNPHSEKVGFKRIVLHLRQYEFCFLSFFKGHFYEF